ncbi:undecaprenyl-phosphate glucose phosphotransferase [Adhaeribacter aquaticus]|uniref:undecaprenyl-phosphate glucose phosphotransferase n=1 Tax=Adhaeribacter aquaticus TaxID=299567 RepID=UPI0004787FB2|nr:undecaprenyl-phosphate glucose phosphotransferase [Adhaeribacter aquaticus]
MANKYRTLFKWINVLTDYFLLNFCLFIALLVNDLYPASGDLPEYYKVNFLLLNLFWAYCSKIVGQYNNVIYRDAGPTMLDTLYVLLLYFCAAFGLGMLFPRFSFPFEFTLHSVALLSFLIMFWKFNFLVIRRSKRRFWMDFTKVVIVGAGPVGMKMADYISSNPQLGYKVEGFFDNNAAPAKDGYSILGKVEECMAYVSAAGIREMYCALPNKDLKTIKSLMQLADKHMVRFRMLPDMNELLAQNILSSADYRLPVLSPRVEPLENKANELLKRIFDISFSLLILVFVLSWVIPLVGLIIKLDSKGPVFFKQLRSGKNNQPFYCFKFRSMAVNADSDNKQATKGDMRVTKVGAFLRKSSIDELPQFINVLLGDMSVVGPRPHMLKHTEDYSGEIENYMVRHFLTPGITGWAQVNGYRGETKETESMAKRVEADIWYLENWSLLLDIKIVFLTVWQAIRGSENAY